MATTGRLAIVIGLVAVASMISLATFFAIAGGPFGAIKGRMGCVLLDGLPVGHRALGAAADLRANCMPVLGCSSGPS